MSDPLNHRPGVGLHRHPLSLRSRLLLVLQYLIFGPQLFIIQLQTLRLLAKSRLATERKIEVCDRIIALLDSNVSLRSQRDQLLAERANLLAQSVSGEDILDDLVEGGKHAPDSTPSTPEEKAK